MNVLKFNNHNNSSDITIDQLRAGSLTVPYNSSRSVSQTTSKGTDVTINETSGTVVLFKNDTINGGATDQFTMNNSTIDVNSIVLVSLGTCEGDNTDAVDFGQMTVLPGKKSTGKMQIILMNTGAKNSVNRDYHVNFLVINNVA